MILSLCFGHAHINIMREETKNTKSSWPKVVVRKWLNIKNAMYQRRRKSCSDDVQYVVVPEELSDKWLKEKNSEIERSGLNQQSPPLPTNPNLRMFVGTWNVGGKSPNDEPNLRDWLRTKPPAHIYVLGFQEIVPLNAGNVLGAEDYGPAARWLTLIREALNENTETPVSKRPHSKPRLSFSDLLSLKDGEDEEGEFDSLVSSKKHKYRLAASKQMVGIFLCVWVRHDLRHLITGLEVSCVGRGIMGYLGNKGSISISMVLQGTTTFCVVCSHLASGERYGDTTRRNSDVMEILKRTRFSHPSPDTILDHDKIIWLGDLNYRLASSCGDTYDLIERNDWQSLLHKDELRIEQKGGRVFNGWEEGEIYFAPTYKYMANSDRYVVQTSAPKEKRRTPAWCDRILWKGEGMKQTCYMRGESTFSDHRPVYSLFSVQLNLPKCPTPDPNTASKPTEELVGRSQSCIQTARRFSVT